MSTALITLNKGDLRNRAGIANYTKHWEKDLADETPADAEARKEVYTEVVNGYYDGGLSLFILFNPSSASMVAGPRARLTRGCES